MRRILDASILFQAKNLSSWLAGQLWFNYGLWCIINTYIYILWLCIDIYIYIDMYVDMYCQIGLYTLYTTDFLWLICKVYENNVLLNMIKPYNMVYYMPIICPYVCNQWLFDGFGRPFVSRSGAWSLEQVGRTGGLMQIDAVPMLYSQWWLVCWWYVFLMGKLWTITMFTMVYQYLWYINGISMNLWYIYCWLVVSFFWNFP